MSGLKKRIEYMHGMDLHADWRREIDRWIGFRNLEPSRVSANCATKSSSNTPTLFLCSLPLMAPKSDINIIAGMVAGVRLKEGWVDPVSWSEAVVVEGPYLPRYPAKNPTHFCPIESCNAGFGGSQPKLLVARHFYESHLNGNRTVLKVKRFAQMMDILRRAPRTAIPERLLRFFKPMSLIPFTQGGSMLPTQQGGSVIVTFQSDAYLVTNLGPAAKLAALIASRNSVLPDFSKLDMNAFKSLLSHFANVTNASVFKRPKKRGRLELARIVELLEEEDEDQQTKRIKPAPEYEADEDPIAAYVGY